MGYPMFSIPNLLSAQRKRKYFTDPTENLPQPDLTVPNSLVTPNNVSPVNPQGGGHDTLANIFNAIAAGAAVFGSNDPGRTIMEQLSMQRQEKARREQMQFEKDNRQAQQDFQRQMQKEQLDAEKARQQSEQQFRTGERLGGETFKTKENQQHLQGQLEIQKNDIEARAALEHLMQDWKSNEGIKDKQFQMEFLKAQQTGNLEKVQEQAMFGALFHAVGKGNLSMDSVINIMNKLNNGEPLDKSDSAAITKSIQSQAKAGSGNIAYKSTLEEKTGAKDQSAWLENRNKLSREYIMKAMEPMIDPITQQPVRDFNGKIQMKKDLNTLPAELDQVMQMHDKYNPPPVAKQTRQNAQGQEISTQSDPIISTVDNLVRTVNDPESIIGTINKSNMTPEQKAVALARVKQHYRGRSPLRIVNE